MEALTGNTLYLIIGGAALVLILMIFILIKRKKKKGDKGVEVETAEYNEEFFEEGYEAPIQGLEEIYTKEANGFITIKLQVQDSDIILESIEPNHNKFGAIHNYNSVVNRSYAKGQVIKLFFNKGKFGVRERDYKFSLAFVYLDQDGNKWRHMYIFKKPNVEGEKHLKNPRPAAA